MNSVMHRDQGEPGPVRQGDRHVHQVLQDVGHGDTRASTSATPSSATFMNLTEGVSFEEMRDGVRIWQACRKDPMDPQLDEGACRPTCRTRRGTRSKRCTPRGAGGQFSAAELGGRAFGEGKRVAQWLTENRWTKRSQNIGERVEGGVRAGLALHASQRWRVDDRGDRPHPPRPLRLQPRSTRPTRRCAGSSRSGRSCPATCRCRSSRCG